MRDWRNLRRASFRGVPFQVDKENISDAGRAIATHTYVKSDTHATEDMGRSPHKFSITAYLASDSADSDAQALISACSTNGEASLVLPFLGSFQVRCTGCKTSHEKSKMGYAAFDLEFTEAGSDGSLFSAAIALGDRIAASALDGLGAAVSTALGALGSLR